MSEPFKLTSEETKPMKLTSLDKPEPVRYGQPATAANRLYPRLLILVAIVGVSSFLAWCWTEFSLEARAERGDAKAEYLLGKRYFDEAISPRDYERAARLIRKSADQGYAAAQTGMGLLYENGLGVRQDYPQAVAWFRRGAAQGFAVAENELGVMYAKGRGVSQSLAEASRWCKLAAAKGSEVARRNLELAQVAQASIIPVLKGSGNNAYHHALLEKVEADGVTVSYRPGHGGFGVAKLKLAELPGELQELCKYAGKQGISSDSAYSQLGTVTTTL